MSYFTEGPFYCKTIEEVKHWPHGFTEEDKWETIMVEHEVRNREWRKKCVGMFIENSQTFKN